LTTPDFLYSPSWRKEIGAPHTEKFEKKHLKIINLINTYAKRRAIAGLHKYSPEVAYASQKYSM
jgi:hypothetical protein